MESPKGIELNVTPTLLSMDAVTDGYRVLANEYPFVPSLVLWRAWEYAAYRHCNWSLPEPVLDIGCGDGRFFRLVWPQVRTAVGVDNEPTVADLGRASGVYESVYESSADNLPFGSGEFASCFANCSLEHMDNLPDVLANIARVLRPGAPFILSVVTDKFIEWSSLPLLVESVGEPVRASSLQVAFEQYHHLVSPFSPQAWQDHLRTAGLAPIAHVPILPELTSRLFQVIDQLWHVTAAPELPEIGGRLHAYLSRFPNFPTGLSSALHGVLKMENDWTVGSGAVFYCTRNA